MKILRNFQVLNVENSSFAEHKNRITCPDNWGMIIEQLIIGMSQKYFDYSNSKDDNLPKIRVDIEGVDCFKIKVLEEYKLIYVFLSKKNEVTVRYSNTIYEVEYFKSHVSLPKYLFAMKTPEKGDWWNGCSYMAQWKRHEEEKTNLPKIADDDWENNSLIF